MNKIKNFFDKYGMVIFMIALFVVMGILSGLTGEMYGV